MKKPEISIAKNSRNLMSRQEYYRGIGESAAVLAFTKQKKELKKLTSISPKLLRSLHIDRNARSNKELQILKDLSPRDISHLKDRVKSPMHVWTDLPSDIKDVKNLISTNRSDKFFGQLGKSLQKDQFEDNLKATSHSYEKFSIEKLVIGPPSGRQNSENLKNWLENMKNTYCVPDVYGEDAVLIHNFCGNELTRQVSVSCIEQGQVLKEVLEFYKGLCNSLQLRVGMVEQVAEDNKKRANFELVQKEKLLLDELIEGQNKMADLHQSLSSKKEKLSRLKKTVKLLKSQIEDLKNNSSTSDDKKKGFSLIRKATYKRETYDGYSPIISHFSAYEKSLELPNKQLPKDTSTQTEKTELITETFSEYLQADYPDNDDKELIICINPCENDENKIGFTDSDMKNTSRSEESAQSDTKLEETKNSKKKQARSKPRQPGKKETLIKLQEAEKKVQEKQEELQQISKKIKIKTAELDFITKTLHYKRVKEMFINNQYLQPNNNLTIEKIFDLKPSHSKVFNILADSEYWGEETEGSQRKKSFSKSMTKSFEKSFEEIESEKYKRLNTIKESCIGNEEFQEDGEVNYVEESVRKSIFTEADNFVEQDLDKAFVKKSVNPLVGLCEKIDVNRIVRERNGKITQAMKIVEKICGKGVEWVYSKATMNRKLLNKLIFSLYTAFYSRHEHTENFLDYVYYDFYKRYGLKFVSDKKFVEFICSLLKSGETKKFSIFLRFVGLGKKIGKVEFSKQSLEFYLSGLSFLINSKIGVTFNEDFSDKFVVPVARANELIKDQLEKVDKHLMMKVISLVECKSFPDPKRFNLTGNVDGETVLETIIESFESVKFKYIEGIEFLLNTIKFNEPKDEVLKNEILMVIRVVCPNELEDFEVFFDDFDCISLENLCVFAVDRKILSIGTLNNFIKDEGNDAHDVEVMVKDNSEEMYRIVAEMENVERMMKTLPQQVWENKIQNLENGIDLRKPYESIFAFKIFMLELLRVHSTFL